MNKNLGEILQEPRPLEAQVHSLSVPAALL